MQNIFAKITQKNTSGDINNVICNSAQKGLIPQREYFDKDIANIENTNGYFVIKKGDFVYNPRKSVTAPYGPVSVYNYADDGIVSPLYVCFRAKETINTKFYEWYFKSSAWHRYIYLYGDSGVRHDRVSIKDSTFFEMPLHIPCKAEQEKLAQFLSLLDSSIQKLQQLVDSLKSYKRGVLSRIFSSIESKVCLSEISEYYSSNNTMAALEDNGGDYPIYDAGGIVKYIDRFDFEKPYIAIIKDGSSVGRLQLCQAQSSIIGTLGAIFPIKCSVEYLFSVLQIIDFRQFTTGMAIPHIYYKDYKNLLVPYPDETSRFKIAQIISKLDSVIERENNLLSLCSQLKECLLQKLFI